MYAHPGFVRDDPESLLSLRKITCGNRRRLDTSSPVSPDAPNAIMMSRSVSPSTPSTLSESPVPSPTTGRPLVFTKIPDAAAALWPPVSPFSATTPSVLPSSPRPTYRVASSGSHDRGKLDLLALAMERTSTISSV
jgi:hypothetical protein